MTTPETPAEIRLHDFPGGLHLDGHKKASTREPIAELPLPPRLVLPLAQHIGNPAKAAVRVGQRVLRGQVVADADGYVSAPVHASSSGTVVHIGELPVAHPSGLPAPAIVIETDGLDQPQPDTPVTADWANLDSHTLRQRVREAGIVGLGGAAFPSYIKLNPGRAIDTLVINGAECEPYISCDQVLMAERADGIVHGIRILLHALAAPRALVAIEDNKPEALRALRDAARGDPRMTVVEVPTRYPQGGEKQLIRTLTGLEVPSEGLPLDIGIVCHNPGTAYAVYRAIVLGQPLISRIVTVTGGALRAPRNYEVRLGTPIQSLIDAAGGFSDAPARLLMGGPMMGFIIHDPAAPVAKATNCILALSADDVEPRREPLPCIRCGACAEVCPARLLPQQLYWHAKAREFDKTEAYSLFDCIECGCCAHVCPSHIPLVQYYRHAKTEIWAAERERQKADAARDRFEARKTRLEREAREKEEARRRKKEALAARGRGGRDPVAEAIAAGLAKKQGLGTGDSGLGAPSPQTPLPKGEGLHDSPPHGGERSREGGAARPESPVPDPGKSG